MSLRTLLGWAAKLLRASAAEAQVAAQMEAGMGHYESGDLAAAERAFGRVLAATPEHARALGLMGVVRLAQGRAAEAEALLRRAIALDAAPHLAWFNLGNALAAQSQVGAAADAFEAAAARAPGHFPALFNLGRARLELQQFDAAIAAGLRFVRLQPDDAAALTELGTMHYRKAEATLLIAEFDAAIDLFRQALALADVPPATLHNARLFLGDALGRRARHTEALLLFRQLHAAAPDELDANINLANCLNSLGRMRDAAPHYDTVVRLYPEHLPAVSSAISAADYDHRLNAADNTHKRGQLMRLFAGAERFQTWPNPRDPQRRLRLGYISPDYREHVAMTLFAGVLAQHDRRQFEIHAYDATAFRDARNRDLRASVDHWREIDSLSTTAAAALIRADGIDLLVDLAGHTAGNRLMVLARKPAPLQATWLAYPGSTGLAEVDYIVSDPYTSPPDCDAFYSETVWRLPHTRFCFTPPADSPAPRLPPTHAPITLGCFNNLSKINPAVLALWKRILDTLPAARLLFKYSALDDRSGRDALSADLAAAGIDAARVEMRGWTRYVEALDAYADVHIALDPFPFCGGLTSLDALWMGVPVITLSQQLMAGRQTEAFLRILTHPELVAADADAYVRTAVELAHDPARIARYRQTLRATMQASALLDYPAFTRELEGAWRGMWRAWCARP